MTIREALTWSVVCPTCNAGVGRPCRGEATPYYRKYRGHVARRSRALAEAWTDRPTPVARPPAARWGGPDGAA